MAGTGPTPGSNPGTVKTPVVRVSGDPHKPGGPANGSAAAPAPAATVVTGNSNRNKIISGAIGAAVLVVAVALLVWKPWKSGPPRLNDEPYKIARFVASSDFQALPFDRQFTFMELLDDKEDAIAKSYDEHKLSDEEYARALQFAYLGKHLKRAKNYSEKLTPTARREYLDKQIDKKKKGNNNAAGGGGKPKANSAQPADSDDIKRDDSEEQETIAKWPADAQAQWTAYRTALKARKDQRKEEEEKQKAAATQQASKSGAAATAPANGGK